MNNPETRPIKAVATPARIPKSKACFISLDFQDLRKRNKDKNKKKNAADSFSGIPAIVLDKKTGITIIKNVEIKAIIFALFLFNLDLYIKKISLTNKKKTIIVKPNIITGNNTAANSTLIEESKILAILYVQAIIYGSKTVS